MSGYNRCPRACVRGEGLVVAKVVKCPACGEDMEVPTCPSCGLELFADVVDQTDEPEQTVSDQDQTSSGQDQTASDQDQTWSDHDATASEAKFRRRSAGL